MDINVTAADKAIDTLIEKRGQEAEAANREAQAEAERLMRYTLAGRRERRAEWAAFYRGQIRAAESMRERVEARLLQLLGERT